MSSTFVYKTIDQFEIKAEWFAAGSTNAPLIIYIHGGGLIWGTRQDLNKTNRPLSSSRV